MIRFAMSQLTQCFKDGINNLYNYSALMGGTFANSMNSLATNAQYLKNSMGAMAAPLINALAPAIDFVIGKVVALFNILNQLFARLTGSKTYTAAKKVAATYGGAAKDAAGTASKAAKKAADEIKRYTLGSIKLPHFSIYGNFSLNPPSIPHFSVSWYKTGGILEGAQLFGMMGNTMLGGGEAGREAVLPLENHTEWMDTLAYKVRAGLTGGSQD